MNLNYFGFARTALKYGLIKKGLKESHAVLVPKYICEAIIQPLKELKIKPVYYDINKNFEPEWDNLKILVNKKEIKAIMMVHYFGQPQEVNKFQSFCKEYNLILIEDNAHGFGGSVNGKLLGTHGNIGISSPKKILNLSYGGSLYINGVFQSPENLPVSNNKYIKNLVYQIFKKIPILKLIILYLIRKKPNYCNYKNLVENAVIDCLADSNSKKKISRYLSNKNIIFEEKINRHKKWKMLHKKAIELNLKPVFKDVHPESNPWMFPAYFKSTKDRNRFIFFALRNGILCQTWPILPKEIQSDKKVFRLWSKLICAQL